MATIKEINHDSSTTLSDHYGSITDPDGAVTVTTGAALKSSTNGIDANYDAGGNIASLVETFAFSANEFRWRVIIKLDNLVSAGTTNVADFFLEDSSGGDEFRINITSLVGSLYEATAQYNRDVGGIINLATAAIPSTGEVCMEIRAIRESGASAADGEVEFFIDGVSIGEVTTVENFTQFAQIAQTRIRFNSNFADLSGDLFYDQWILDDDADAALGCGADESGTYIIGQAIDTEEDGETLYATIWRNSTLYLQRWSVSGSPTKLAEVSLGAATFSEVSTKTTIAWPYAGSDSDVWVFGRMSSPVGAPTAGVRHILSSTVGGTGTWSDVAGITGSWGINDVMDSLHVTPPVNDAGLREFAAVRRRSTSPPELWIGNNALALSAVIAFPSGTGTEYKGMHKSGAGGEISVGSAAGGTGSADNRIFSTVPPYTTTRDISFDYPSGTVEVLRYF